MMYSLGPELFLFPAVQFQMQTHPWGGSSLSVTEHFQGGRFPDPSFSWPGLGSLWGLESSQPPSKKPHVDPSQSRRILSPLAGGLTPQRVLGGLTSGAHCTAGGQQPNNITQCYTVAKVNIPPVPSRATWGETHWLPTGKTMRLEPLQTVELQARPFTTTAICRRGRRDAHLPVFPEN